MKNVKASVLIANYNNEKYIQECLKSLSKQTYSNFEVIFHDDNSKDKSIKKAKKFSSIKIIRNKIKSQYGSINQMHAYKRAFDVSKGEIIFFLDSDDYFKKNKIEKIISIFDKKKNLEVIYDLPIILNKKKKIYQKNKKKLIKSLWPYIPPQSCISLRRSSFEKIFDAIKVNNFFDVWMDFRIAIYLIYLKKNFYILNQNLTIYRKAINSVSSKFKFLSASWWLRRKQAYDYLKFFLKKNRIKFIKYFNFDYFITKILNSILK